MWMTIISFLGGPVVKALIDAYSAKLKAENVDTKIAADLAAGEIASQTAETKAVMQYRIADDTPCDDADEPVNRIAQYEEN